MARSETMFAVAVAMNAAQLLMHLPGRRIPYLVSGDAGTDLGNGIRKIENDYCPHDSMNGKEELTIP